MRKFILLFTLILSFAGYAQEVSQVNWEDVIITNNPNDVKDLSRVKEIESKASKLFGGQKKLRSEATEKLKKEAAELGASAVFIQSENFSTSPINNYYFVGVAYK